MSVPGRRRLVIVSNRIPFSFIREEDGNLAAKPSSGGLVSALEPLLRAHGGLWVGSAGTEDSPEIHAQLEAATRDQNYRYAPLFLTDEEQSNYYEGFSNEVLWPLFHDLQSLCVFDPVYWEFYKRVNARFAAVVEAESQEQDVLWVQDYQLLQVAHALRQHRPHSRIAFFLHTPFPPPDIFEKLPWRLEVLEGLLDYDLIGLQTERDKRNLVACLRNFVPRVRIERHRSCHLAKGPNRQTAIESIPISIDYHDFAHSASNPEVTARLRQIREQMPGLQLALGVDRLDYTKGIPERLRAFRALLRAHPEFRRRITFIQVVVPSREGIPGYQDLLSEIEKLVSSVNGDFSEPGWTPVQYMHHAIPREELLALYRAAEIALVTPLKDGMNLVAKEYCASQIDHTGTLILSEFAGAAPELRVGAILVNPYDEWGMAAAIRQAIEMPAAERRRRMMRLRRQIRNSDILHWRDRFFAVLDRFQTAA